MSIATDIRYPKMKPHPWLPDGCSSAQNQKRSGIRLIQPDLDAGGVAHGVSRSRRYRESTSHRGGPKDPSLREIESEKRHEWTVKTWRGLGFEESGNFDSGQMIGMSLGRPRQAGDWDVIHADDDQSQRAWWGYGTAQGKRSWAGYVMKAAKKLRLRDCPPLDFSNATAKSAEAYRKTVEKCALEWLQREFDTSDKLYQLHGRLEPQTDKPPAQIILLEAFSVNGQDSISPRSADLGYDVHPLTCLGEVAFLKAIIFERVTIILVSDLPPVSVALGGARADLWDLCNGAGMVVRGPGAKVYFTCFVHRDNAWKPAFVIRTVPFHTTYLPTRPAGVCCDLPSGSGACRHAIQCALWSGLLETQRGQAPTGYTLQMHIWLIAATLPLFYGLLLRFRVQYPRSLLSSVFTVPGYELSLRRRFILEY
ncbi:hypothetical protein DFH09DRAFT_1079580 [Mycena vulgaris]|nr:hypothetical protein DFH09DRAFT_1079580 [Mycena vulgaris]